MKLHPHAIAIMATLVTVAAASCDDTIIVAGRGKDSTTTVVVTTVGTGGAGPCGTPFPVLPWTNDSVTAAVGTSGGPLQCNTAVEDGAGHRWEAACTVDGCSCTFDGAEVCSCENDPPLAVCDSIDNCCPQGWPRL